MDAIVTAGGIPLPEDPLYPYTEGHSKALLDIAGKPMLQWVLDALSASQKVGNVIIMGMTEKSGFMCSKPTYYLPNEGRMLANIVSGIHKALELDSTTEHVLIVSSDIPAVTGSMERQSGTRYRETDQRLFQRGTQPANRGDALFISPESLG